eukprot:5453958-Amphidinium_carterae.2
MHKASCEEVSRFIKDVFVGKADAYFIFTSHRQGTGSALTAFMEGDSSRKVEFVFLPISTKLLDLQRMDAATDGRCNDVTHMKAALYGRIPALVWSVIDGQITPSQRFHDVLGLPENRAVDIPSLLDDFLAEVLTGEKKVSLRGFRPLTDAYNATTVRWIPCFMASFLSQCGPKYTKIAEWLNGMESSDQQDGKAWEKIVAVAFAFRYLWQQRHPETCHWADDVDVSTELQFIGTAPHSVTVEEALESLPKPSQFPTLQLVLPTHAQLAIVDLFAVKWTANDAKQVVMVAQQKEGKIRIKGESPPVCPGGKALWLRGAADGKM